MTFSCKTAVALPICLLLLALVGTGDCCFNKMKKAAKKRYEPIFVGCFKDDVQNRDFVSYGGLKKNMKPSICNEICEPMASTFLAVHEQECWCGNSYGKHGQAKKEDCSAECPDSDAGTCGGPSVNSVFSTKYED